MTSYDASKAADLKPVAAVLADLRHSADRNGVQIMVVGAVARDILIRHALGAMPQRATADLDIAVAVSSWPEVSALTKEYGAVKDVPHKFLVRDVEVDVIPFGEIESAQRTITWSNDHRMDVFGFREALDSAVTVALPGGVTVAVASLPAQSLLKLFAWRDRRHADRRDAIDFRTILRAYSEGPYFDELYEHHAALLEEHDFDPSAAGARRIGQDAKAIIDPADVHVVTDLLDRAELFDRLVSDMGGRPDDDDVLLSAYRAAFG